MQRGSASRGKHKCKLLLLLAALPLLAHADPRCVSCHPKEVAGYAKTGMARSLAPIDSSPAVPDGAFEHEFSHTEFTIRGNTQQLTRAGETAQQTAAFVIGSGNHAFGYLIQVGNHVFQSPLAYYTQRKLWGVAPGYENDPHPDFSRPVSNECLSCHSGKPLPVADSQNMYQPGVFAAYAITCERCHGDASSHLKNPVPGSILNPAKLSGAARSSVCEQCHLTGEIRIPNPNNSITNFQPGHTLEEFYTTYIAAQASGKSIKVVSHAEQLALSKCARMSGDKLWCGTCHNPHDEPVQPAAYFRDRCLTCHAATLAAAHAAPGRDCIACHMPQMPTTDGGHSAFTNHRIARYAQPDSDTVSPDTLTAWREPDPSFRNRNLALALVTVGLQNQSSAEVIRGYRLLNQAEKQFPDDVGVLTSLGTILMKGKQPAEALKRFQKAVAIKPDYAPAYVNQAAALLALNQPSEAALSLKKALSLDSLLQQAVQMLGQIYQQQGQPRKAEEVLAEYQHAMGSR